MRGTGQARRRLEHVKLCRIKHIGRVFPNMCVFCILYYIYNAYACVCAYVFVSVCVCVFGCVFVCLFGWLVGSLELMRARARDIATAWS